MTKVIDTHAHLGECCVFGLYSTEDEMLRRMDENGVDATRGQQRWCLPQQRPPNYITWSR